MGFPRPDPIYITLFSERGGLCLGRRPCGIWPDIIDHTLQLAADQRDNQWRQGHSSLTPFAVKIALLDAAIRVYGQAADDSGSPSSTICRSRFSLPERLVVINTFIRSLRPHKSEMKDTLGTGVLKGRWAIRSLIIELVHFGGPLSIGLETTVTFGSITIGTSTFPYPLRLDAWGSSSSFSVCQQSDLLLSNYAILNPRIWCAVSGKGLLQLMDDCGPKMMTFARGHPMEEGSAGKWLNAQNDRATLSPDALKSRVHPLVRIDE